MRKLLSANLARLWKSKVFWVLETAIVAWGVFVYILAIHNAGNLGPGWVLDRANANYYHHFMYIAAAMAVFCALFFGAEYEQGALRNKLAVGHSRESAYLSNLVTAALVCLIFTASHALTALVAVPFVGAGIITAVTHDPWRYLCWALLTGSYSALFTALAMLDDNKARNAVISILLALALIFAGIFVHGKMTEPEFISRWISNEYGQLTLEENVLNTSYPRGAVRTVLDWCDVIMPSAQGMRIINKEGAFDIRMPLCSAAVTALLTISGVAIFKRKDIK